MSVLKAFGKDQARQSASDWAKWRKVGKGRMGDELLSTAHVAVARLVHLERCGSPVIEEVDADSLGATIAGVGRQETAIEVWEQIDIGTIVGTWVEDAAHCNADVWLGVVADESGIN